MLLNHNGFMIGIDDWRWHPSVKGTETAQKRTEIARDWEQSALDTFSLSRELKRPTARIR
ncbi:hypothetical protein V1279_003169 [Bradyrhizobium sp. AZCC 1610]|uniref:hypothetical protein n=1 Tax=Bradyrhizobium sp. AZCC 1610 TaxID=3117020 RepID=UPI002FF16DDF